MNEFADLVMECSKENETNETRMTVLTKEYS